MNRSLNGVTVLDLFYTIIIPLDDLIQILYNSMNLIFFYRLPALIAGNAIELYALLFALSRQLQNALQSHDHASDLFS